jgi:hypothetical protein
MRKEDGERTEKSERRGETMKAEKEKRGRG